MKYTKYVDGIAGAGMVLKRGKHLMVVRGEKWGFPKGTCEGGETIAMCAIREVFEETNHVILIPPRSQLIAFAKRPSRVYFMIENAESCMVKYGSSSNRPDKKEIKEIKWMTTAELMDIPKDQMNSSLRNYLHNYALSVHTVGATHDYVPVIR